MIMAYVASGVRSSEILPVLVLMNCMLPQAMQTNIPD